MNSLPLADLLVDDNWIAIFSLLPEVTTKLAISQAVEVNIGKSGYRSVEDSFKQLIIFIQTYCTSVVDVCIKVVNLDDQSKNWLDPVFQIRTLQRLSLLFCVKNYEYSCLKYKSTKAPNCPDLRLLNVTCVKMNEDTLITLLSRMPNLEELYLYKHSNYSEDILPALSKCKKLQRLAAPEAVSSRDIIRACPSLQYYIFYQSEPDEYDSDESSDVETEEFSKIGNTFVVADNVLDLNNSNVALDRLRLLAPLIVPYTSGVIESILVRLALRDIADPPIRNAVVNFLVNELHYDVNAPGPEFIYRQSFTSSSHSYRYGLSDNLKPDYIEKYPLEAVLHSKNSMGFGMIRPGEKPGLNYWIQLGAKAECPEPNRSYLTIAHRAILRLFLLQHGADPNKIINRKQNIPVFFYMFMDQRFEDSAEVVQALLGLGVDFSVEVEGKTALGWMIMNSMWKSFEALMKSGIKLSSADQFALLKYEPNKFLVRITTGVIDVTLRVPVVLHMINTGLGPQIAPYINENINKMDENGYTLYHYMSMTSTDANMDNKILYKIDEGTDLRWVLKDFKNCSWRDPKQVAEDQKDEEEFGSFKEDQKEFKKVKHVLGDKQLRKVLQPNELPVVAAQKISPQTAGIIFAKPNIALVTKDGETGFLLVCKSRLTQEAMTKRVQHNLAANPDINRGDKNGWTPLHALCYGQYWQAALMLVNSGANINAQDNHGVTPLMAAIYGYKHLPESMSYPPNVFTDNFCALITAFKFAFDANSIDKFSKSLLHLAVSIEDPRLVLELIKLKCNVNARDLDGYTPLHIAAMIGARANVIEALVKNGADVNAQTNSLRLTPAMVYMHIMAAFRTSTYTLEIPQNLLYFIHLEACSNMMRGNRYYREVIVDKSRVAVLLEAPWHYHKNTFSKDEQISTEKFYDCDAVFEALTQGADLTLTDVNNFNYLHFLVMMCGDNYKALLRVVQHPPLSELWNAKNNFKTSPFLELCMQITQNTERSFYPKSEPKKLHDNMFLYELVTKYNINVMECDYYGMFPFYFITSAKWTHFHLEKWTSLPGVDLSIEILEKATLFDKLRRKDLVNASMLRGTIAKSPSFLHRQDPCGATLLIQLVEEICFGGYNHQEFLEIVLQDKSHVNIPDVNGNTALHIACQFFNLGAVDSIRFNLQNLSSTYPLFVTPFLLLDAGADPSIKNNRGETPLTYVPLLMNYYESLYKWVKDKANEAPVTNKIEEQKVNQGDDENSMSDD